MPPGPGAGPAFQGHLPDPRRERLQRQVYPDCRIQVVLVSATRTSDDQEISLDSICNRILRIADVQFNLVEEHKKGGLIYERFIGYPTTMIQRRSRRSPSVRRPRARSATTRSPIRDPSRRTDSSTPVASGPSGTGEGRNRGKMPQT
jgi:hypothetical protein